MFLELDDLLTAEELEKLRAIAAAAPFVDGKISNPHNTTKNNLQLDQAHPFYAESSALLTQALMRNEQFRLFALPAFISPPLLCRYRPGMSYGVHSDVAHGMVANRRVRFDVSCTIFISPPEACVGGELASHLGDKIIRTKGAPGSAIVYPSSTLHEVTPLTSGERLVAITFIESEVRDPVRRELLYHLNEVYALEGMQMDWTNRVRLQHVHTCLKRMWSE